MVIPLGPIFLKEFVRFASEIKNRIESSDVGTDSRFDIVKSQIDSVCKQFSEDAGKIYSFEDLQKLPGEIPLSEKATKLYLELVQN